MLRYKDKNGVESPLVKCENLYIEEVLDYGDKTLGFSIPKNLAGKIELEDFIRTKTDEFVIKQMNTNDNGEYDIVAKINIDELEGASFQNFETVEQTATDTANLALAGTGWTCECIGVTLPPFLQPIVKNLKTQVEKKAEINESEDK